MWGEVGEGAIHSAAVYTLPASMAEAALDTGMGMYLQDQGQVLPRYHYSWGAYHGSYRRRQQLPRARSCCP